MRLVLYLLSFILSGVGYSLEGISLVVQQVFQRQYKWVSLDHLWVTAKSIYTGPLVNFDQISSKFIRDMTVIVKRLLLAFLAR